MAPLDDPLFWSKVDASGDCWIWTAYADPKGYGRLARSGRHLHAHRYSYELLIGPIPEGLVIDHLCFNPPCVNPDHLEVVTRGENNRRRPKLMTKKSHCVRGHEFTPENTYLMKRERQRLEGMCTYTERVCRTCVRLAQRRHQERRRASEAA